jgi:large subunit ribosomal protein L29
MKVDELRVLEGDELTGRLKTVRRELYELRFKHAVGQLENSSQIKKVRHEIARIMTVLTERDLGIIPIQAPPPALGEPLPQKKQTPRRKEFVDEEEEPVSAPATQLAATEPEAAAEAAKPEAEAPKKRSRKKSEKSEKS